MATNLSLSAQIVSLGFLPHLQHIYLCFPLRCPNSPSFSLVNRLRPLVGAISAAGRDAPARCFATNVKSLPKDLPREKTVMEGCDFKHWLVVMMPPEGEPTWDEIVDSYIKTLVSVVGR